MKSLFANLNTRQLIIHFIAFWFFAHAFFILAFLHDFSFLHQSTERMLLLNNKGRYLTDKELVKQAGNLGLVVAYIISWVISNKRNWHWINSVIVFIPIFVLYNSGFLGWDFLDKIFLAPGKLFPENSIGEFTTNGVILLVIGCFIMVSKKLMRYIDKGNPNAPVKGNKADRKAAAKAKMAK